MACSNLIVCGLSFYVENIMRDEDFTVIRNLYKEVKKEFVLAMQSEDSALTYKYEIAGMLRGIELVHDTLYEIKYQEGEQE